MRGLRMAVLALGLVALGGCDAAFLDGSTPGYARIVQGPQTEQQVEAAAKRYGGLLLAMDAAGVAGMYAPDGVWERSSGPLQGREAIRAALANTNGVTVLGVEMKTQLMSYNGPAVIQTGDIDQTVKLPNGKTVTSSVRFEATWVKSDKGEWWIRRMATRPNAAK